MLYKKTFKSLMPCQIKRIFLSAGLILAFLSLSACGFQPVYLKNTETGYTPQQSLQTIRISPFPDQPGQILHNMLRDRLNPLGQPRQPLYSLKATITETTKGAVVRLDNTVSRTNLTITVSYLLERVSNSGTVFRATARSTGSFDKLDDPYTNLVAEDTARNRVLRQIADDMALQLGTYFSRTQ